MKRVLLLVLVLFVGTFAFVFADTDAADQHGRTAEEVLKEIRNSQDMDPGDRIDPDWVDEELLEELGEAWMSLMVPDAREHSWMDEMMGGEESESLSAMHRVMGYRYLSGDGFLDGMMGPWRGGMMMGGGMMGPWRGGMMMQPWVNSSMAVLLSLQPLPVALGQFYLGDWRKGLLFTAGETLFMGTAIGIMMWENSDMMHGNHAGITPIRDWSQLSQVIFFSSLGGYLVTKLIDVITAGIGAATFYIP